MNVKKIMTSLLPVISNVGDNEGKIKIGKFAIVWNTNTQSVSSSSPATWDSNFGFTYTKKPVVFTQIRDTTNPQIFHVSVENITTTGCRFRRQSTSTTSYSCSILWIAIGILGDTE